MQSNPFPITTGKVKAISKEVNGANYDRDNVINGDTNDDGCCFKWFQNRVCHSYHVDILSPQEVTLHCGCVVSSLLEAPRAKVENYLT